MTDLTTTSAAREQEFRRLLRWYPRQWRAAHGDALLGTLLDAAEAEARAHPTGAERRSALVQGVGARLDDRVAMWAAVVAMAAALLASIGFLTGATWMSDGAAVTTVWLSVAVTPWFMLLAAVAWLRARGRIDSGAALLSLAVCVPGVALAALAHLSWSAGFDAADERVQPSAFATAFPWLALAAWGLGTVAVAIVALSMLRATSVPGALRLAVAVAAGGVTAIVSSLLLRAPLWSVIATIALVALTAVTAEQRKPQSAPVEPRPSSVPPPAARATRRRAARAIASVGVVIGIAGYAIAFIGPVLTSGALDGTESMRAGVALCLVSGAVALVAFAITRPVSRRLWGSVSLFALSLLLNAVAMGVLQLQPVNQAAVAIAVSAPAGIAIAWLIVGHRPDSSSRWIIAVAAALAFTLALGAMLALVLAFAMPIAAFSVAVWRYRVFT